MPQPSGLSALNIYSDTAQGNALSSDGRPPGGSMCGLPQTGRSNNAKSNRRISLGQPLMHNLPRRSAQGPVQGSDAETSSQRQSPWLRSLPQYKVLARALGI